MKGPWFAGLDFLVTSDPLNIQHVLTTNFANYPMGSRVQGLVRTARRRGFERRFGLVETSEKNVSVVERPTEQV